MLALDTETDRITEAEPIPQLVSVQLAGFFGSTIIVAHDPRLLTILRAAFREGVVMANAPFDVSVLIRAFPELETDIIKAYANDRVIDVITCDKLIDTADGTWRPVDEYSLAHIAYRRTGLDMSKSGDTWRMHYGLLLGLELSQWPLEARQYAELDAVATWAVYLWHQQRRDALIPAFDNARADWPLWEQSMIGMHTDPVYVGALDTRWESEIDCLQRICYAAGLVRHKHKVKRPSPIVRSKNAAQQMFADIATADPSIFVTMTDPTDANPHGQISLSQEALEAAGFRTGFVAQVGGGPVLVDAQRWKAAKKEADDRKATFDPMAALLRPGMLDVHPLEAYRLLGSVKTRRTKVIPVLRHPVVRTSYDCCVDTGRTSSHGFGENGAFAFWAPSSTNFQNQERDNRVRGCLIPPPGHEFAISDFGMLELVALAQVELDICGRSALADALRKGIDVHAQFGADMIGIPLHEFNKKIPAHAQARQGGKAWNFGKPGGMGQRRFIAWARKAYGVEVTPEEERQHTRRWLERYPEHEVFFNWVRTTVYAEKYNPKQGRMEPLHRIQVTRCGHVRGGMRYPDACNTNFQTLGAYIAKRSLWKLFVAGRTPTSPMFGCRQVLFVHDEHVTVCPIGRGTIVVPEQERLMIEASAELAPDVPIKIESYIKERYEK